MDKAIYIMQFYKAKWWLVFIVDASKFPYDKLNVMLACILT